MKPSAPSFDDHLAAGEELDKAYRQHDAACERVWAVMSNRTRGLTKSSLKPTLNKLLTAKRLVSEVQAELLSICCAATQGDYYIARKLYDPEKRNPDLELKALIAVGRIKK